MKPNTTRKSPRRSWRAFAPREGQKIEQQLLGGGELCCPECGGGLGTPAESRLARDIPLDAFGYDLDCSACRRFWCIVHHTARSLRLVRMRRLAAAVRAVGVKRAAPSREIPAPNAAA